MLGHNDDEKLKVQKINSNFLALNHDTTVVQQTGGGGGSSSVKTHQDLGNSVLLEDCHPIKAISGLVTALAEKLDKSKALTLEKVYPLKSVYETTSSTMPTELTDGMT